MKKKILIPVIIIFVCILLFAGLSGGDNDTSTKEASKTEDTEKSSDPSEIETVSVDDPMNCPAFTAEKNSSDMDLQIYKTAKDYKDTLTDEQAAAIVNAIKEENPKFYDGPEEMEKFLWYGYLLQCKYEDSDPRAELGTDLVQAIKYVYRNVETVLDDSTKENLKQINKDLGKCE